MADLLERALAYAENGYPVFPCWPADIQRGRLYLAKSPMTPHGLYDATTDADQITRWWTRWKHAAIGMPTGLDGGWDVLDVDKKPDGANGFVALQLLRGLGLIEGAVKIVHTPSGGRHYYFPASGTMANAQFAKRGIDLRGGGGYVVVPPSAMYRREGNVGVEIGRYTLRGERATDLGSPLDHVRVHELLRDPEQPRRSYEGTGGHGATEGLIRWLGQRVEGERAYSLFWAACRLVERGEDPEVLRETARGIGLPDSEIDGRFRSAHKKASRTA